MTGVCTSTTRTLCLFCACCVHVLLVLTSQLLCNRNRGALVNAFSGHTGFVLCVAGSPNSALLVSGYVAA